MFHVADEVLHNPYDAEEVVHDACLILIKNFSKISSIKSLRTKSYIVSVVENRAIDRYREKLRYPLEPISPSAIDPNEVETRVEGVVSRCILHLPPNYRQLILLRYEQGYSPQETAKIMGLSMSAAYKLEQRAKAKLAELCQKEGISVC